MTLLYSLDLGPENNGEDFCERNPGQLLCRRDAYGRYGLEARFIPADNGSPRLTFLRSFPSVDEATLTYKVWFEPGFEFVRGGKLPGLGSSNPLTGCADASALRWSVRCMWGEEGRLVVYYYGQNRDEKCGDDLMAHNFRFVPGEEYRMQIRVRLNNPGYSDGTVELRVNNELLAVKDDLELRGDTHHDSARIQKFIGNWFFGGSDSSWAPSRPQFARFFDIQVRG